MSTYNNLSESVEKSIKEFLNEQNTPNSQLLDYIFDVINNLGKHKLTRLEKKYYDGVKAGKLDKEIEQKLLEIINGQDISIQSLIRDFEATYGDQFKKYNFGDETLSIKTKAFLVVELRKFFGLKEIKGVYSNLQFDADMTVTDIINNLRQEKQSVWGDNEEFLNILKKFLFEYLDNYLGLLSVNGFSMDKIR